MVLSPRLSGYLRRFRPTAAPGAAAPAGVPADFAAGLEAELAPVFAALDDARLEAEQIRARARHEGDDRRAAVSGEVEQILADARREAAERRAELASSAVTTQSGERERLLAAGAAEADRIRAEASARLPDLVARVVGLVRDGAGGARVAP